MTDKNWFEKTSEFLTKKASNLGSEGVSGTKAVQFWFAERVVSLVNSTMTPSDRDEIVAWFQKIQLVLEDKDSGQMEKVKEIYNNIQASKLASILFNSINESLENYKTSDLPLAVKIALPIGIGSLALLGGQGAGIAAFGGAVGAPVVLVVFVGAAGVASIVEGLIKSDKSGDVAQLLKVVTKNEILRRKEKAMQEAMKDHLAVPKRMEFREDQNSLIQWLREMDPFDFERHVMSFFPGQAGVSPASNDYGFDGWCIFEGQYFLVQCKRYSESNKVGRPEVQAFKGAIGDKKGDHGIIVTTSTFTSGALESIGLDDKITPIDIETLLSWHENGLSSETLRSLRQGSATS